MSFDAEQFIHNIHLKNKQRKINKKYVSEGLTDEVLEMQLEVNRLRNLHDIPDTEHVHDGFSQ
jgi:hypothetical protein